jgi:hypothetical protein
MTCLRRVFIIRTTAGAMSVTDNKKTRRAGRIGWFRGHEQT